MAGAEGAPIAGAIAGMLFAVLFGVAVAVLHDVATSAAADPKTWVGSDLGSLRFGIALIPFAGVFFLWFIAVSRQHLGHAEDRFFSTVFMASGILFLGMIFVAAAAAAAIAAVYSAEPSGFADRATYVYAQNVVLQILDQYALRMSGVFLMSQGTLWLRTGVMPRWIAVPTIPLGLVLLLVVSGRSLLFLVFPAWVFLVSVYILAAELRARRAAVAPDLVARGGAAR